MSVSIPEKPALEGLEAKWQSRWEAEGTYRFDRTAAATPKFVDVLWRRLLFDGNATTASVTIFPPTGFTVPDVRDVLGASQAFQLNGNGSITFPTLGQPPRVVIWTEP